MNLKNKIYEELCDMVDEINKELLVREIEIPIGYSCCECNFQVMDTDDKDAFWEVFDHLQNIHGYPDEDAGLSVRRINR